MHASFSSWSKNKSGIGNILSEYMAFTFWSKVGQKINKYEVLAIYSPNTWRFET